MAVPVELGETFRVLEPRALFSDNGYERGVFPTRGFDVHPNGDTFVMVRRTLGAQQLVVVIGWLEEVRGRATSQ